MPNCSSIAKDAKGFYTCNIISYPLFAEAEAQA